MRKQQKKNKNSIVEVAKNVMKNYYRITARQPLILLFVLAFKLKKRKTEKED